MTTLGRKKEGMIVIKSKKKYLHEYTVDQIINEVGLYQKMYISLNFDHTRKFSKPELMQAMKNQDATVFNDLIYHIRKIVLYCNQCDRENTFDLRCDISYSSLVIPSNDSILYVQTCDEEFDWKDLAKIEKSNKEYFICKYQCAFESKHNIIVQYKVDVEGEELVLQKIGQYPSIADLQFPDLRKYEKIMGDNYHKEFTRAIGLFSHGIGIGSFVYLRRIYENLIEEIHNEYVAKPEWVDSEYTGKKFNVKINYLESLDANIFPAEITDIKTQIYGVISKGIHEYTEEECMTLFEPLKFCIESILDHKYEKDERRKKAENALKIIQKIKSDVTKKEEKG